MDDVDRLYAEIGRRVRRARATWTQGELAYRLGMTRSSVANLEAGRQRVPIHVIYQIAQILRVQLEDLLPASLGAIPAPVPVVELPDDLEPSSRAFIMACLAQLGSGRADS